MSGVCPLVRAELGVPADTVGTDYKIEQAPRGIAAGRLAPQKLRNINDQEFSG